MNLGLILQNTSKRLIYVRLIYMRFLTQQYGVFTQQTKLSTTYGLCKKYVKWNVAWRLIDSYKCPRKATVHWIDCCLQYVRWLFLLHWSNFNETDDSSLYTCGSNHKTVTVTLCPFCSAWLCERCWWRTPCCSSTSR